jgi:hypothetical protein
MDKRIDDYRRWQAADADGRDDDADEALLAMFREAAVNEPAPVSFTARTMTAVAAAAAMDARRARQARLAIASGSIAGAAAAIYTGAGWAISFASAAFLGLVNLLVAAVVGTVDAFQTGTGIWGVLSSLGQATAAVATDSSVTFALIAISVVAIAALATLQRLLGSDEGTFQ